MKILIIPDPHQSLHGLNFAKEKVSEVDKIVVMGDYCDEWESSSLWNTENNPISVMKSWIDFKSEFPDKVELLIGNHDLAYMNDDMNISGHQNLHHTEIKSFLTRYHNHFNIAIELGGYVFSHAGFSKTWVERLSRINDNLDTSNSELVIEFCNRMFHAFVYYPFSFSGIDCYGNDRSQGPLWIRPNALIHDMAFSNQVVGHTEEYRTIELNGHILMVVDSQDHKTYTAIEA